MRQPPLILSGGFAGWGAISITTPDLKPCFACSFATITVLHRKEQSSKGLATMTELLSDTCACTARQTRDIHICWELPMVKLYCKLYRRVHGHMSVAIFGVIYSYFESLWTKMPACQSQVYCLVWQLTGHMVCLLACRSPRSFCSKVGPWGNTLSLALGPVFHPKAISPLSNAFWGMETAGRSSPNEGLSFALDWWLGWLKVSSGGLSETRSTDETGCLNCSKDWHAAAAFSGAGFDVVQCLALICSGQIGCSWLIPDLYFVVLM